MCLAIPNSIRSQQNALPYSFLEDATSSSASSSSSSSSSASAGAAAVARADGQSRRNGNGAASASTGSTSFYSSPFELTNTPPPNFNCALGPTGLSPLTSPNSYATGRALLNGSSNTVHAAAAPSNAPSSSSTQPTATTNTKRRRRCPQRPGKTATHKERLFVKHDYHDLSGEPDVPHNCEPKKNVPTTTISPAPTPVAGPLMSESFPAKLHRILEEVEEAGLGHIISWQPHGRAFKIRIPAQFTEQVMANYFPKMKKLTSLQRQFNLYGFERLTRDGPDAGAYYHEAFLRYRPGLSAQRMSRKRVKGTGYKAASNPEAEPDLYSVPSMDEVMRKNRENVTNSQEAIPPSTSGFPSCSYGGKTTGMEGSDAAEIVTESNRSSCYSSSDESVFRNQEVAQQQQPMVAAPVPSAMFMPQVQEPLRYTPSNNTNMERNQAAVPRNRSSSIDIDSSMDQFLSLSEATQDAFLRDFFSSNDITPLSPQNSWTSMTSASNNAVASTASASSPINVAPVGAQHKHQQGDPSILVEFAHLWESALFHPTY